MTNGGTPKLEKPEDLLNWAIHYQAVFDQTSQHQGRWNEKQETWMLSHERRIQANENRGGKVVVLAMFIGAMVSALIPFILGAIRGG